MGRKDPPSKISLRRSLFPHVPPYIHFTSVVLSDVLPTVRSSSASVTIEIFSVQTLTVAAPEGLEQFYSVKECLILAGLDIKQAGGEVIFRLV